MLTMPFESFLISKHLSITEYFLNEHKYEKAYQSYLKAMLLLYDDMYEEEDDA